MSNPFQNVINLHPQRSVFNLSYEKKFTARMGLIYPVMCDEVLPGDKFIIGNQQILRFQPLVAPVMHEISSYVHYFFVPYRILWSQWEQFITGGEDGNFTATPPLQDGNHYTEYDKDQGKYLIKVKPPKEQSDKQPRAPRALGDIWDMLGLSVEGGIYSTTPPLAFPFMAYNLCWNEYYRDENLQDHVDLFNEDLLFRNWEKDYFTSALPFQQKGDPAAIPISATGDVNFLGSTVGSPGNMPNDSDFSWLVGYNAESPYGIYGYGVNNSPNPAWRNAQPFIDWLNNNNISLNTAPGFTVSDLRLAFQIQKWQERNARAGSRYFEFLKAHFGVSPRDERLQRPEYIGGTKSNVIVSEVLQTSQSGDPGADGTPQGNMAGHGIMASAARAGSYFAEEHGLIIGLMSIKPRSAYSSQGIPRQWSRLTKFDYYTPEFANLSEQAILNKELCVTVDTAHDNAIFGYQGYADEYRVKDNMICTNMRQMFSYWHFARRFDKNNPPALNSEFISLQDVRTDPFAVQDEDTMIINFGNVIKAIRPMPIQSMPGLIDHN